MHLSIIINKAFDDDATTIILGEKHHTAQINNQTKGEYGFKKFSAEYSP